jgi:hypothetical protein
MMAMSSAAPKQQINALPLYVATLSLRREGDAGLSAAQLFEIPFIGSIRG